MTQDERFLKGIENLGLHVEPSLDTSALDEYVVVSYNSDGTLFGDDAPCLERRNWQMVYAAPIACNCTDIRSRLRRIVYEIYDVWPSEEDVSDAKSQRFLYEFTSFGGIEDGPDRLQ